MQINDFPGDEPASAHRGDEPRRAPWHPLVVVLAVLLFAECALLTAATAYLLVELLVDVPESYPSAIFLTLLTAGAAGWLGAIAVGVLRRRSWTRGAATVWQVLQGGIAIACFQGIFAQPTIGWLLLVPAILVLVLLFTPPVVAALRRV
jgi:hypothetical protein